MTIYDDISKISKSKRVLFTTPSHDRTSFVLSPNLFGRNFYKNDLSEINGLDNLSEPQDCILKAMKKSAELIGAENVFYLVNGSSSGILAAMLSALNDGDKILIARNCHKSVVNGLILSGAEPVWLLPEINEEWGIFNPVSAEEIQKKLSSDKNIKAVLITSPTYEGISSDIGKIAEICHNHNALLIVDEAHGALKSFYPEIFGKHAVSLGADIAIQSLHKTCGAINPSAVMLCGKNADADKIQAALNLINTTSPSFPVIASIEETIDYLFSQKGQKMIEKLVSDISDFKNSFSENKKIEFCGFNDVTKILVKISGLSGFGLSDILFDRFNIEDENTTSRASMLLTGIGTKKSKLNKLKKALKQILSENISVSRETTENNIFLPDTSISPRKAFFAEKEAVPAEQTQGRICTEIISEYPPGIPLLLPGEIIKKEHMNYLKSKKTEIFCIKN